MDMEDRVRAAQRGDPMAMTALMRELMPWIGRICGSIALDRGDDAAQETLIIVLRNLPTLREPAALRAWARRIAVRESVRMARGGRDIPVAEVSEAEPPAVDLDGSLDVRTTLARLPPHQRAVLALRYLEDLSEEQTAEVLGVKSGTVKSRAHRARQAFEERWRQ
jgi:RNA polymerase sigma-70 factor (ECF subfamily)